MKEFKIIDVIKGPVLAKINSSNNVLIYVFEKGFLDIKNGLFYHVVEYENLYRIYKDDIVICENNDYEYIVGVMYSIIHKVKLSR